MVGNTKKLRSALVAGLALAAFVLVLASAAAAQSQPGDEGKKARAPKPVPSFPLIGIEANLPVEAANAACAFAQTQPEGQRLMLFNFGQAHYEGGQFGAGRRPFHSNDAILEALTAAADRYRDADCHLPRTRATIAYGVTNHELSEAGTTVGDEFAPMSPELARQAGAEQLEVAKDLRQSVNRRDDTAVAGDIEPAWDSSLAGVEAARALVRGANTGEMTYFNFGTAGHCPPYPGANPGCGSWGLDALGEMSQKRGAVALPQMYHAFQAEQWDSVRENWNQTKVRKPKRCSGEEPAEWPAKCFTFAGATSQPVECGADYTPRQSWKLLRDAVPAGAIGEELVFYNPGRLNCARSSDERRGAYPARDAQAYELLPRVEPARIVAQPDPVVPADVLDPVVNAWRAGDHNATTLVQAGLAGDDPSGTAGRFVIFRERQRPFTQDVEVVDVPGSGTLRITGAPTGRGAARSAQREGEIEFAGEGGISGALDLRDDGVTLGSG